MGTADGGATSTSAGSYPKEPASCTSLFGQADVESPWPDGQGRHGTHRVWS